MEFIIGTIIFIAIIAVLTPGGRNFYKAMLNWFSVKGEQNAEVVKKATDPAAALKLKYQQISQQRDQLVEQKTKAEAAEELAQGEIDKQNQTIADLTDTYKKVYAKLQGYEQGGAPTPEILAAAQQKKTDLVDQLKSAQARLPQLQADLQTKHNTAELIRTDLQDVSRSLTKFSDEIAAVKNELSQADAEDLATDADKAAKSINDSLSETAEIRNQSKIRLAEAKARHNNQFGNEAARQLDRELAQEGTDDFEAQLQEKLGLAPAAQSAGDAAQHQATGTTNSQ